MDTLYWTGLNPNIKFLHSTRMMYGQFLYKLSYEVPGSNLLRIKGDLDALIEQRNLRSYNYGGSWRQLKRISHENHELLTLTKSVMEELSDGSNSSVRVRVEEPNIHFYTTSVQDMVDISKKMLAQDNSHLVSVTCPADSDSAKLMQDGFVLRKTEFEWKHKIVLRDGRYSDDTKQQLYNFLIGLGDEVKAPLGLLRQLEHGGWIWGGYFYTNDPQLTTIVSLINPRLVGKVEEFKVVPSKK